MEHPAIVSILPRMPENSEVAPKAVSEALASGDAQLIDVREKSEYDGLHIPGSVLIPLGELPARLGAAPEPSITCARLGGRTPTT